MCSPLCFRLFRCHTYYTHDNWCWDRVRRFHFIRIIIWVAGWLFNWSCEKCWFWASFAYKPPPVGDSIDAWLPIGRCHLHRSVCGTNPWRTRKLSATTCSMIRFKSYAARSYFVRRDISTVPADVPKTPSHYLKNKEQEGFIKLRALQKQGVCTIGDLCFMQSIVLWTRQGTYEFVLSRLYYSWSWSHFYTP